jgi:hypothetical protein
MPHTSATKSKPRVPKFTLDQKYFLECSLSQYKEYYSMTWADIAAEILESEAYQQLEHLFNKPAGSSCFPIEAECLRKFVIGDAVKGMQEKKKTVPHKNKLFLMYKFLRESNAINEKLFITAKSADHAAYALAEHYNSDDMDAICAYLEGSYYDLDIQQTRVEESALRLRRKKNERFLRYTSLKCLYDNVPPVNQANWNPAINKIFIHEILRNSGWASVTSEAQVLLFMYMDGSKKTKTYTLHSHRTHVFFMKELVPVKNTEHNPELWNFNNNREYVRISEEKFDMLTLNMKSSKEESDIFREGTRNVHVNVTALQSSESQILAALFGDKYLVEIGTGGKNPAEWHNGMSYNALEEYNESGKKFLDAMRRADKKAVIEYLDTGGDVNFVDPATGVAAIHIAAHGITGNLLSWLATREDLDYLLRNKEGYLASEIAVTIQNTKVREYLGKKEIEQARKEGIDYLLVLSGKEPPRESTKKPSPSSGTPTPPFPS